MHAPCKVLCKLPLKLCRLHKLPRYDCPEGAVGLLRLGPASRAPPGWLNHPLPCLAVEARGPRPVTARYCPYASCCNKGGFALRELPGWALGLRLASRVGSWDLRT
jgi:hypothetical protein